MTPSVHVQWEKRKWRIYWHLGGGLAIGLTYLFYRDLDKTTTLVILGIATIAYTVFDILRLHWPRLNEYVMREAAPLIRERERTRLNTSTFFFLSSWIAIALFSREIAAAGILFLAVGDPSACIAGTLNHDRGMFAKGKTIAGSLTCLVVCTGVALMVWSVGSPPLGVLLIGAGVATVVELTSGAYDNLIIPVASGAVMLATETLFG